MLKLLRIHNIILIESSDIYFEAGFNVLSGETGSGKSAILSAIGLISGERADTSLIRRGADKGSVEAVIELPPAFSMQKMLDDAGIDFREDNELIIRREIHASGKGRAFINHQPVQITLLRRLAEGLIDLIGQHANRRLLDLEEHRAMTDLFGDLQLDVQSFAKTWDEENELRKELDELIRNEAKRMREIEVCRMELEELESSSLKEGEDEELFAEYTFLNHSEELSKGITEVCGTLASERHGVVASIIRSKNILESLTCHDPTLAETVQILHNTLVEVQEVGYTLENYMGKLEHNPKRIEEIDDRLALINKLKRKYGTTLEEIAAYSKQLQKRLVDLETADQRIEELQAKIAELEKNNTIKCSAITAARKKAASTLEKAIGEQLRTLNMPNVEFHIDVSSQKRSRHGDDRIEFFLIPNKGEGRIAVRDCASGGELSRLMLSLCTLLAGKEQVPTLVFDEIDANIGGATASVVGEKLREIGRQHQVLCVTHFPQVAKYACYHLQISKQEREGRTLTLVKALDTPARDAELARMQGRNC